MFTKTDINIILIIAHMESLEFFKRNIHFREKHVPITLIVSCFILAIISVLFFTRASYTSWNFSSTGQIGDTIGGLTAPVIGILNALLLWWTIRIQNQQILDQKIEIAIDKNIDVIREEIRSVTIKIRRNGVEQSISDHRDLDLKGKHKGLHALTKVRSMFALRKNRWKYYQVEEHDWLIFSNSIGLIIMLTQDTLLQNQNSRLPHSVKSAKYRLVHILVLPIIQVYINIQKSIDEDLNGELNDQYDVTLYQTGGIDESTLSHYNPDNQKLT